MSETPTTPFFEVEVFPFPLEFQKKIVIRLCRDRSFLLSILSNFNSRYFENAYLQIISGHVVTFYLSYRQLPSPEYLVNMIQQSMLKDPRLSGDEFNILLQEIYAASLSEKDDYLREETQKFLLAQSMLKIIPDIKQEILKGNFEGARQRFNQASLGGIAQGLVVDHKTLLRQRVYDLQNKAKKGVPTILCPRLDEALDGGLGSGELLVILAPTGKGKTLFLVNFARGALIKGLNVLYITLEVAADIICVRLDSSMSSMTRGQIRGNPEVAIKQVETHYAQFGGRMVVAQFPANKTSVSQLEALLNDLPISMGFQPHAVMVDYADLLRSAKGREERRHELTEIYTDLRELGKLYDIPIFTASQSNRGSFGAELVDLEHVAEDIGKVQIADVVVSLCQNKKEAESTPAWMRLFLAKNRNNPSGYSIETCVNPATMQIYPPPPGAVIPDSSPSHQKNPTPPANKQIPPK